MVRYADDFVIQCRSSAEAARALELVRAWVEQNGLELHPTKTRVVHARTEGFDFLGYHFHDGRRRPRDQSLAKFKETVRAKTKRTDGSSLGSIIASLNRTLRGWFAYFQHSKRWILRWLDGWIRRRLRSLLCQREKRRSIGRGWSHHRWPNAFFAAQGLYRLERAHELARQPSLR